MQTHLADFIKDTPQGREAESILRKCTHCGFCLANCPTYRLLGDELDSPRGRIYQVKELLEGATPTASHQLHLDRCLTCRACETTCPSGVHYSRLADIGRELIEREVPRSPGERLTRSALRNLLPRPALFGPLMRLGQALRPLVPGPLKGKVPVRRPAPAWPARGHSARVLMLEGCVQPAMEPPINPHTARLLDGLGLEVVRTPAVQCCGAVSQHLGAPDEAAGHMRRNIDAWWPHVEAGARAVVVNASGCGAQLIEYGHLLAHDPDYAEKARRIAELTRDPVQLLEEHAERLEPAPDAPRRIAFHTPCTLQHAMRLNGRVDALLRRVGFELTPVVDPHICCGSAGTYSVLQPKLAKRLRKDKLDKLQAGRPELIATANIGCLTHLAEGTGTPVRHWVELLQVRPA